MRFNPLWINTALKRFKSYYVHYLSFNPLWINTALKLAQQESKVCSVSIPYGLTLLSNDCCCTTQRAIVSIPYGLTLLSNYSNCVGSMKQFQSPMD